MLSLKPKNDFRSYSHLVSTTYFVSTVTQKRVVFQPERQEKEVGSTNMISGCPVFSLTLARSPMASRSYWRASDFLNYSPGLASDILAERKSEKKKNCYSIPIGKL